MNSLTNKKATQVMKACLILFGISLALSFAGTVFAADSKNPTGGVGSKIIKGSENIPEISVSKFLRNIGKSTGIYKIIHTETGCP